MSQQKQLRRPTFCPHLKLQWTLDLIFPNNSRPCSPTSPLATSASESSSTSSLPKLNDKQISPVNGVADEVGRGEGLESRKHEYSNNTDNIDSNHSDNCNEQSDQAISKCYSKSRAAATYKPPIIDEDQDCISLCSSENSFSRLTNGDANTHEISAALKNKKVDHSSRTKRKTTKSARGVICCQCGPISADGRGDAKKKMNYWRCLNRNCNLIFCGAGGENHAHVHFLENPGHVLQENTTSRRIWCNECDHEVYRDWRNRRLVPAIWTSSNIAEAPPKGLFNIGNTCFMNAALQNITAVSALASYFLGDCCNINGKNVALNYRWLLGEFNDRSNSKFSKGVMPSRLLHSVRTAHPIFRGFQQHDAQEFLRLFMDTLAEQTLVPHFILDDTSKAAKGNSDNESETESFETCDSGNGSEETDITLKLDDEEEGQNSFENSEDFSGRPTKVVMKSIISSVFDGQIESSVQCLSCHQVSRRNEVFQDLSLPIPTKEELSTLRDVSNYERDETCEQSNSTGWIGWLWGWVKSLFWGPAPTLEDCFAAFFSSDELKGKNMYSCEKCKKLRNGVKRCSLYKLPEVLCVHLKRFRMYEFNAGMGYSSKIGQYVKFPSDGLDVRPYLHKDCIDEVSNYRLMGIICHMGSVMGGHYTAYIRKGDKWYLCDDSHVGPVSWETVMECEAYVLFYQKWSWDTDVNKDDLLRNWTSVDGSAIEENKFHLISRKWLTQFFWGEEAMPLDNSDVVCPHGYIAPYENVEYGATWIPHLVWDLIMKRYGGGPDLKYSGACHICAQAWRKHQRTQQRNGPGSRTHSFSDSSGSPKSGNLDLYYRMFVNRTGYFNSPSSNSSASSGDSYSRSPEYEMNSRQRRTTVSMEEHENSS